jgi:hypothetical protein
MHRFHEISGHNAWYTESGSHHVRVKLPADDDGAEEPDEPSVRRVITFTYRLPFWSRVKVLLGWRLVVRHTAIAGLHVEVGSVVPPRWWSGRRAKTAVQ